MDGNIVIKQDYRGEDEFCKTFVIDAKYIQSRCESKLPKYQKNCNDFNQVNFSIWIRSKVNACFYLKSIIPFYLFYSYSN